MKLAKRIALGTIGLLLMFASLGIIVESGLFPRRYPREDNRVDWRYAVIGAPILVFGVWLGQKAGMRSIRPFANKLK